VYRVWVRVCVWLRLKNKTIAFDLTVFSKLEQDILAYVVYGDLLHAREPTGEMGKTRVWWCRREVRDDSECVHGVYGCVW
jgi:hypothetical protein